MSETVRTPSLTGGCQCGAVRYALYALPVSGICHCRMCQKAVGGPFAVLGTIATADFAWTRGHPGVFQSSSMATRGFCASCGTPLTYQGDDLAMLEVTICSLDEPGRAPPTHQDGVEARQPWLDSLATLPSRPTQAKFAGLRNYQHLDHETASVDLGRES